MRKLKQALQAAMVVVGLVKFPLLLCLGCADLVALMEFIHAVFEVTEHFKKR